MGPKGGRSIGALSRSGARSRECSTRVALFSPLPGHGPGRRVTDISVRVGKSGALPERRALRRAFVMVQQSVAQPSMRIRDFNVKCSYDEHTRFYLCLAGEALTPRIREMVDGLCEWLSTRPEYDSFLRRQGSLARVRRFHESYWRECLSGGREVVRATRGQKTSTGHAYTRLELVLYMAALDWCERWLSHEIDGLDWDVTTKRKSTDALTRFIRADFAKVVDSIARPLVRSLPRTRSPMSTRWADGRSTR